MGQLKLTKEAARRIVEAGTETRTSTRQTVKKPVRGKQIEIVEEEEEPEGVKIYVRTTANELKAIKFGDGLTTSAQTATLGDGGYLIKNNGVLSISNGATGVNEISFRGSVAFNNNDFELTTAQYPLVGGSVSLNFKAHHASFLSDDEQIFPTINIGSFNADIGGGTGNIGDNSGNWVDDADGTGVGTLARKLCFVDCNLSNDNELVKIQPKRYSLYLSEEKASSSQVVTDVSLVNGELIVTKKTIVLCMIGPDGTPQIV